jgi:hypothetical protein
MVNHVSVEWTKRGAKMSDLKLVNLRELDYSPLVNPLMESKEIRVQKRYIRTRTNRELQDPNTGEIVGVNAIHVIEERDDAEFVKVFAEGVKAAFSLTKSAYRVFQAVLAIYEKTPMRGGYAEAIELFWFGNGLNGKSIDMSEKTFQRGLKELLSKNFLAPKSSSLFWVNPALFFKGDRVAFVKEYRRRSVTTGQQMLEEQRFLE